MLNFGRSAALHMYNIWEMYSSVRLFNKFICSAFQHHCHIWGIQCTKNTQMSSVHSFSISTQPKIQTQFHFQWNIKTNERKFTKIKWKKNCSHLYLFLLFLALSFILTVLTSLLFLPLSGFSFSNSIDSCVCWVWYLTHEEIYSISHFYRKTSPTFFSLLSIIPQLASEVYRKTKISSNEIRKSINRKWMMLFYVSHKMCYAMNLFPEIRWISVQNWTSIVNDGDFEFKLYFICHLLLTIASRWTSVHF